MPRNVALYRILVASPSDCADERKIIPEVIHSWNAAQALSQATVLQPVMWEIDARPELGGRPQEILNRQLLDTCDCLVGIFWTRLGTDTGKAASGTVEEIDLFRAKQKQVLLYFSDAPVSPSTIDIRQYEKVQEYRSMIMGEGIFFTYTNLSDLRDMFSRHLAKLMVDLLPGQESLLVDTALREIMSHTWSLWDELCRLALGKNWLQVQIGKRAFEMVQASLDTLAAYGHLRYTQGYELGLPDPAYHYLTVEDISTQLRQRAKAISIQGV